MAHAILFIFLFYFISHYHMIFFLLKDRPFSTSEFNSFITAKSWFFFSGQSKIKSSDKTWYFFRAKKNKYITGDKQNRSTSTGFWKVTGNLMNIMGKTGKTIGEKRVLVFYLRNRHRGSKTEWIIHEYNALDQEMNFTISKVKFKGVGNPGNQDEPNESAINPMDNIHEEIDMSSNPTNQVKSNDDEINFTICKVKFKGVGNPGNQDEPNESPINPRDNIHEEIDMSSNPTNQVESNDDGLADLEDMMLDNESYQEPFNNPPNPNKDFSDDIQRLPFDEKTNNFFDNGLYEQASNVPMNMFGDIEGLPNQEEIDMLEDCSLQFHLEETNHALHKAPTYEPKGSLDNEVFHMQEDRND